ncbi:hypothetical protein D3C75_1094930 [compost metagenome]
MRILQGEPGQKLRRASVVIQGIHISCNRIRIDKKIPVCFQECLLFPFHMTQGDFIKSLKADPAVHLMFSPIIAPVIGKSCPVPPGQRFGDG